MEGVHRPSEPSEDPNEVDNDQDGYTENDGDCDDFNNTINPGAQEIPDNGVDEDCSGADQVTPGAEIDNDGDGFTENDGDCDDSDRGIHPGMTDIEDNGIDEDCDGLVDDMDDSIDTSSTTTVYADMDGDSYGDPNMPYESCGVTSGYVSDSSDCDDADAQSNPIMAEICGDGVDNNCDGVVDEASLHLA